MKALDLVHINPASLTNRTGKAAAEFGYKTLVVKKMPGAGEKNAQVYVEGTSPDKFCRVPPSLLVEGPYIAAPAPAVTPASISYVPLPTDRILPGTVVVFKNPRPGKDQEGLHVVCAEYLAKHQVRRLGGEDTWWRGIRTDELTVVPLDQLAAMLAHKVAA